MDDPVAYPRHATMAEPSQDTTGSMAMQMDWVPPETYITHASWSLWQQGPPCAGDAYGQQWATAPLQLVNEHQWPTLDQGEGPGTTCAVWLPLSEGFSFQQQQQQQQHDEHAAGHHGSSHYDPEDSWAPAMPPTPQLTPTWHPAQMVLGQGHTAHQAVEAQEPKPAVSPAAVTRKPHQKHEQPSMIVQTRGRKRSQFACTDTMATPPEESGDDQREICTSGTKRTRLEEPIAAAPVPGKKYRVKNRAAAKRCRDKSRQFEIDLAAKEKQLTEDHMFLEASAAALREEILALKNQILQHGDCNCEVIQTYISKVASQVSNASACHQGPRR